MSLTMADRDGFIWLDGKLLPWREAKTHVLTHALHYGSAVFEGGRIYDGRVFRLAAHGARLRNSARLLDYELPWTRQEIDEATRAVVRGPYDVSLVEGSVTTPHDAERLHTVRRQSRTLITIGACATAGGIQALFDLGATVCTPARPRCVVCPWLEHCAGRRAGIADALPKRSARRERPMRHGVHFWLADAEGNVLLRRRPHDGLLGGMAELPGTEWRAMPWPTNEALTLAPMPAEWRPAGKVLHGFTHFALAIELFAARVDRIEAEGFQRPIALLDAEALPSLMRKCVRMAGGGGAVAQANRALRRSRLAAGQSVFES